MKKSHIVFVVILLIQYVSVSAQQNKQNSLPIGVFDSGTGGLTVLEAMLTLDAFNNETGKPGPDGKPVLITEPAVATTIGSAL